MNLKEKIAKATNAGNLAWDEEGSEASVDRVAALGLAQVRIHGEGKDAYASTRAREHLASCLWRLKYGGDRSRTNYAQAFEGVIRRVHGLGPGKPGYVLRALVAVAIEEWRVEVCPTCHGRRFVGGVFGSRNQEARTKACDTCLGSGILQRDGKDRARAVMNLLYSAERDRVRRGTRVIHLGEGEVLIVMPRPEHLPDLAKVWERGWGAKYQRAIDVVIDLDSRLGSKVRRKLEEEER